MSCINQKSDEPVFQATSNAEFLANLRNSWSEPYQHSAFLKDIPRLVRRVRVQTVDGVLHGPCANEVPKAEAIVALLELISTELGVEQNSVRNIRSNLNSLGATDIGSSEQQVVAHMFEQLDPSGPVIKALRLINQGTVLYAMSVLKEEVLRDIMTKDVRTPEGWQIVLRLGDVVQLEHIRTEQSLDELGDQRNHFEVQWMVMTTFDRDMEQLRSCSLRLLRFNPVDSMEPERLAALRSSLIEGLIVL